MTTSTQAVSRALLNQETDARFWLQTHYKIGKALDLRDPTDRAMAKVWQDIFLAVQKEDRAGRLHVTFNDPEIKALLAVATAATDTARTHIDAAIATSDPNMSDAHVKAATQASAAASEAARRAAARQPPTVSPIVVQAAADESARALNQPPPPPVVYDLPADHPAMKSPAARPELSPREIAQPIPVGTPAIHPNRAGSVLLIRDILAEARARAAPAIAIAVHDDAHKRAGRARGRTAPPAGTTPPRTLAAMRGGAQDMARKTTGDTVGVTISPSGAIQASAFPTPGAAAAWYGDLTNDPSAYQYAAYYDKADGATWPAPVEETLGSKEEIPVRVQIRRDPQAPPIPDPVPVPVEPAGGGSLGLMLAAGAALIGLAVLASSSASSGQGSE